MNSQNNKNVLNRLKARKNMHHLLGKMYREGVEADAAGKPLAWCMVNWWQGDAILKAMGVARVYPENYGTVCASSGAAQNYLKASDAEGFPNHLCGYARNCIGYIAEMTRREAIPPDAPEGGLNRPAFMLGATLGCDARFKWFQALKRYWDVPLWVLQIPLAGVQEACRDGSFDNCINFMVRELREFINFLERFLGKKMDWDRLFEALDNQEKVLELWWKTNEFRKAVPCPMHSRDFYTCMIPAHYQGKRRKVI